MKNALVVGGSNGVGLGIVGRLLKEDYKKVYVCDIVAPSDIVDDRIVYIHADLSKDDFSFLDEVKESICALFITAGIGSLKLFENVNELEIEKTFKINTVAAIRIIKYFYNDILSDKDFFTGVMVSIAGFISSPFYSIYSASKGALVRFIESVNVELTKAGAKNRITNISPGKLEGTKFHNPENDLSKIQPMADLIYTKTLERVQVYIPRYEETYKAVLERYNDNPIAFGLQSYDYKQTTDTPVVSSQIKIGYLSGTFDLFHVGHLNLLRQAKECCDYLIVGVHRDASHKGKETFIPFDERCEIVESVRYVDKVVESCKEDSDAWDIYRYDYLFVGDDYKGTPRFEAYEKRFAGTQVKIVYFQYTKKTSSTKLRELITESMKIK